MQPFTSIRRRGSRWSGEWPVCYCLFTGRPARMLVFSQWSKNRFFVPQGRHVALINVTFGTEERTCSPLPLAKCHVYRGKNVGIHPQNCQNFEFWPEICALGASRLQYFLTKSSVFEVGRKVTDLGHPRA